MPRAPFAFAEGSGKSQAGFFPATHFACVPPSLSPCGPSTSRGEVSDVSWTVVCPWVSLWAGGEPLLPCPGENPTLRDGKGVAEAAARDWEWGWVCLAREAPSPSAAAGWCRRCSRRRRRRRRLTRAPGRSCEKGRSFAYRAFSLATGEGAVKKNREGSKTASERDPEPLDPRAGDPRPPLGSRQNSRAKGAGPAPRLPGQRRRRHRCRRAGPGGDGAGTPGRTPDSGPAPPHGQERAAREPAARKERRAEGAKGAPGLREPGRQMQKAGEGSAGEAARCASPARAARGERELPVAGGIRAESGRPALGWEAAARLPARAGSPHV